MPFNIGAPELIIILVIALLILGPGKLPEVGSALGKSIREFRKASTDLQDSLKVETNPSTAAPPQPNTISQPAAPNTLSQPAAPTETGSDARRG
ncbi:MAG TPA: twin-arginine translocase TatA/TatE family subunit [Candidatus Limnocylindrales bacterium]